MHILFHYYNNIFQSQVQCPQYGFIMIKQNIFKDEVDEAIFEQSIESCRCLPTDDCSDNCENRAMYIECDASLCSKNCTNQRIQKGIEVRVKPILTENRGRGLKLLESIQKTTPIIEYIGEVIQEKDYKHRLLTKYGSQMCYCGSQKCRKEISAVIYNVFIEYHLLHVLLIRFSEKDT